MGECPEGPVSTHLMCAYLGQLSAYCEVEGTVTRLHIPVSDETPPTCAVYVDPGSWIASSFRN